MVENLDFDKQLLEPVFERCSQGKDIYKKYTVHCTSVLKIPICVDDSNMLVA